MSRLVIFLTDDDGAVATDWVVLTGGIVGLGIATLSVVSGGIEDLSGDIAALLSDVSSDLFGNGEMSLASSDFTGGDAVGWLGGTVMDMGGAIGEVLVLGAGEATQFVVDVPEGAEAAIMQFDLVAGDSLDSSDRWGYDTAHISLNGQTVAIAEAQHGSSMTFDIPQVDGTIVEATVTVEDTHLGGSSRWTDSAATVTVTVDEPTGPLDFGLSSNSNQGISDEYWGIDNFEAVSTGGSGS